MKGLSVQVALSVIMKINEEINRGVSPEDEYYFLTLTTNGEELTVGLIEHDDIFSTMNDDRQINGDDYESFEGYLRRKINELVGVIRKIPEL